MPKVKAATPKPPRIIVGSTFINEPSEWGWKYGFTLNAKITREQLTALIPLIEKALNKE